MRSKQAIYLDILHGYLSEMVATFPASARKHFYGTSRSQQFSNGLRIFLKALKTFVFGLLGLQKIPHQEVHQKHWLYVLGPNNYHSLQFIAEASSQTVYVSPFKYQAPDAAVVQLHQVWHFWYMLRNLPLFFRLLFNRKAPVKRCWDVAFKATGLYESSLALLKKHQPRCITFSNDHTLEPRAMLLAAQTLKIPSFYIQHACIRSDFPPLRFSHSLLEGKDALHKYKNSGSIEGKVSLIGIPRMDPYMHHRNENKTVRSIGLCSNLLDNTATIQAVLNALSTEFPDLTISYRPHPSDQRKLDVGPNIKVSNSRTENPFEFLIRQDLIIAGNTSIHYEAAILNVVSVYYQFDPNGKVEDMYNFVANKLVKEAADLTELMAIIWQNIQQKQNIRQRASYYNAVLDTPNEGKSKALALAELAEWLGEED